MSYPQESFKKTVLTPGTLLHRRRNVVLQNTLHYQLNVLKETGRYNAFKLGWHASYSDAPDVWPIPNHLFWDSDIAKWIEGACYLLHEQPDEVIESAIQELVIMINHAQQPDGYLNIHYTVVEPGKRFTNLRDMHELYNAGHLIEAALAHHALYNNEDLLGPILRYVDLLCHTFGPRDNQIHGYPGHPEIELALIRLHERTRRPEILELARYFLNERGNQRGCHGEHYYVAEAKARNDNPHSRPAYWPTTDCLWYYQAHKPILEQETIEGHSVRAMYLLTAAADLARINTSSENSELFQAVTRLWRNMVDTKMYVTGGIGAIKQWEGFGKDYYLPQGTDEGGCYSETCAAIGVMMLAERMLQIDLNGEYGDIMELCLYNSVLTSMSYDGKAFTYVNQLASSEQDPSKRESWFTCACCPPNIMRLLGQISGYISSHNVCEASNEVQINVHLFLSSTLRVPVANEDVEVSIRTNWPWSEDVSFEFARLAAPVNLNIRIPGWAHNYQLEPACPEAKLTRGYLAIPSEWIARNPSFALHVPLKPRLISPHPFTNQVTVSLARGPIVYCVEDVDNTWVSDHFKTLYIDPHADVQETPVKDEETGDEYVGLSVKHAAKILPATALGPGPNYSAGCFEGLLSPAKPVEVLHFVPYYFRANRKGRGQMRVGLRRWDRIH